MAKKKKKDATGARPLFAEGQTDFYEKSYEEELEARKQQPVECLGVTFENDDARREHFTKRLREKLKDPEFRKVEGFPIGEDEDILALSNPPYYTACPNPFVDDFIRHYGRPHNPQEQYDRGPFTADVSEGKNDPIYNAHAYHTKVPHRAIMRYILHYTEPGDVVFDGFCGTGMTGIAAQLCADKTAVGELGYRVGENGDILSETTDEQGNSAWQPFSKLGPRRAVLSDLSPAATTIASNYNSRIDVRKFESRAKAILNALHKELGWMYVTLHAPDADRISKACALLSAGETSFANATGLPLARINFTVWSDVFLCPECAGEIIYWENAIDVENGKVHEEFTCPSCTTTVCKRNLDKALVTLFDRFQNKTIKQSKQVPVLINYSYQGKRYEKAPDEFDRGILDAINDIQTTEWVPNTPFMFKGENWGDTWRAGYHAGITHAHHFYTVRNLITLAELRKRILEVDPAYLSWFTSSLTWVGRENRLHLGNYFKGGGGVITSLRGTWYIASLSVETNVFERFRLRMRAQKFRATMNRGGIVLETTSASASACPAESCDYIFTDPPFGGNLMYSELNFIWEAWLKVYTNPLPEAVENKSQKKDLMAYQKIMTDCFHEYFRVLKPGRWITVEFHNSLNSVWNAIQEGIQRAGFVIADVRTLDKGKGSFKQVNSAGAVKQDLIISAYKPNDGLEKKFRLEAGTQGGVWDFVRTHLRQLPVFVGQRGEAEILSERQDFLLFDRMVAFHVQRGVTVPMSASEFYGGLAQRFVSRDGMFFLQDQVAEYDKRRMTAKEVVQLELFVQDEATAIQWLKQQLTQKPQTFQELHPQFMREIGGWQKFEKPLELREMLEQNFLCYEGTGDVPGPIHSYLSTNFKDLRNLDKGDPALQTKAKNRWHVPDPNKAGDLEKLRERVLLKEFEEYKQRTGKFKRGERFRLEAIRAGFKRAWQDRDYAMIIAVAEKIPNKILEEDQKLLMWYDQAVTRTGE